MTNPSRATEAIGNQDKENEHPLNGENERVRQALVDAHRLSADVEESNE
jgi:hypothetical protein